MDSFRFDHKLFQRGQTWRECRESWEFRRELFLERTLQAFLLPRTKKALAEMKPGSRLAVLYHPCMLDSMKSVPIIGNTASQHQQIEVRFFDQSVFFPIMFVPFGRKSPRVLKLETGGHCSGAWGPRPEAVTSELEAMEDHHPHERDRWLWDYDDKAFAESMDHSLSSFLSNT